MRAKILRLRELSSGTEDSFRNSVERQIDILLDEVDALNQRVETRLTALEQKSGKIPIAIAEASAPR